MAGSLNYGHNPSEIQSKIVDYICADGILHAMDMMTERKFAFLEDLKSILLTPRGLDYRAQFSGPTGTNSVEAALKLARKVKGRRHVVAFSNAFHGVTMGSLAVTASEKKRSGSYLPLRDTYFFPYEGFAPGLDTLALLEAAFERPGSGYERPAAIILETIQGEGGVNVGSAAFLQDIAAFCQRNDILLIVDDIQAGCGRTGRFFSFEAFGIVPDIVCLSKSLSGIGLPMSMLLFKPDLDIWKPGEHAGTFRGNALAFVAAAEALRLYWLDDTHAAHVETVGRAMGDWAAQIADETDGIVSTRGRGAFHGLEFADPDRAETVSRQCFADGLLIDTCGPRGAVLKLMPPTTIALDELADGLSIIEHALRRTI